ncbi:hypothetical protein MZTS_13810 [Methylorubrum zatmanii]|nr:hypothetical protein [Methylorubrum zatmanii]
MADLVTRRRQIVDLIASERQRASHAPSCIKDSVRRVIVLPSPAFSAPPALSLQCCRSGWPGGRKSVASTRGDVHGDIFPARRAA